MKMFRQWMAATLALALTASLSISSILAAPPAESFADFRIDAANIDVPDRTLSVAVYQPDEAGVFQASGTIEYTCKLNQVTEDASFYIQPKVDGVHVRVDYLADLNGDGVYELLDGLWDTPNQQGTLSQGENSALTFGQTCIMSAEMLSGRYKLAVDSGSQALGQDVPDSNFPLCRITLHRTDPADGQDYEQLYYLEIHGRILLPSDISPDQWYYSAVEYGLDQGYFSGMEDGLFHPEEPLNRAQLAQVLWVADGSLESKDAGFSDVSPDDWFYQAVSWCQQEKIIAGYDNSTFAPHAPLSREQLASILYRYARYSSASLRTNADLSVYTDYEDISPWACNSMRWAVTNRLLIDSDNTLRPGATVSRAELAAALYAYDINLGLRGTR